MVKKKYRSFVEKISPNDSKKLESAIKLQRAQYRSGKGTRITNLLLLNPEEIK
jgi:hypothetical protein